MSKYDSTKPENVEVLLVQGPKGEQGETYDDTDIWDAIRTQNAAISDLTDLVNSFDGLAILQDMAPVEDDATGDSTHAYEIDDYLIHDSQLYKVIANIEIGDRLAVGINIDEIAISEVMIALQNRMQELTEELSEDYFNLYNGLQSKTSSYTEDSNGLITRIVETKSDATATTTFATSGATTTITTTIVPTQGEYDYTKTTVITEVAGGQTITESYTKTSKEV